MDQQPGIVTDDRLAAAQAATRGQTAPGKVAITDTIMATTELRRAYAELEERVEQRTAVLKATNYELLRELARRSAAEEQAQAHLNELAHVSRVSTVGAMMSNLAHELGQPLAAITNYAHAGRYAVNQLPGSSGDSLRDTLEQIADQAYRAAQIIQRVRDFIRRHECPRTAVDVNGVIHDVQLMFRTEARRYHIALDSELETPLPPVNGDRIQIEQVVVNLVKNAIEATRETANQPKRVIVRTERNNVGGLDVTVSDTGSGLDKGNLDRIFEPFYTTKGDGIGLGLSISRSIIQSHGGQLDAISDADGGGATFRVRLPL